MQIRGALNPLWFSLPWVIDGNLRPRVAVSLTRFQTPGWLSYQIVMGDSEFSEDAGRRPHSGGRVTPKAERKEPHAYKHTSHP